MSRRFPRMLDIVPLVQIVLGRESSFMQLEGVLVICLQSQFIPCSVLTLLTQQALEEIPAC